MPRHTGRAAPDVQTPQSREIPGEMVRAAAEPLRTVNSCHRQFKTRNVELSPTREGIGANPGGLFHDRRFPSDPVYQSLGLGAPGTEGLLPVPPAPLQPGLLQTQDQTGGGRKALRGHPRAGTCRELTVHTTNLHFLKHLWQDGPTVRDTCKNQRPGRPTWDVTCWRQTAARQLEGTGALAGPHPSPRARRSRQRPERGTHMHCSWDKVQGWGGGQEPQGGVAWPASGQGGSRHAGVHPWR